MGKWQALTAILVLAVFYITRYIAGDNSIVFGTLAATLAGLAGLAAGVPLATLAALVAAITFAVAVFVAAFAPAFAGAILAAIAAIVVIVVVVVILAVVVVFVGNELVALAAEENISKKRIFISCAAEFVFILLPILSTVRGWW